MGFGVQEGPGFESAFSEALGRTSGDDLSDILRVLTATVEVVGREIVRQLNSINAALDSLGQED